MLRKALIERYNTTWKVEHTNIGEVVQSVSDSSKPNIQVEGSSSSNTLEIVQHRTSY